MVTRTALVLGRDEFLLERPHRNMEDHKNASAMTDRSWAGRGSARAAPIAVRPVHQRIHMARQPVGAADVKDWEQRMVRSWRL